MPQLNIRISGDLVKTLSLNWGNMKALQRHPLLTVAASGVLLATGLAVLAVLPRAHWRPASDAVETTTPGWLFVAVAVVIVAGVAMLIVAANQPPVAPPDAEALDPEQTVAFAPASTPPADVAMSGQLEVRP